MRLRPSGRAGTVATSLSGFAEYQREKAWVWEHLALTRARAVAGTPELLRDIDATRKSILRQKAGNPALIGELKDMRRRIGELPKASISQLSVKKPLGGSLDIELIAQALSLRHNLDQNRPDEQISAARQIGALNKQDAELLMNAHSFFGQVEHLKRLLGKEGFDAGDLSDAGTKFLVEKLDSSSLGDLQSKIATTLKAARETIEKIIIQMDQTQALVSE